ncbi:uncharacterized protein ASPGLDRAFT_374544 [Aspergillus glaucus CBS 516.65]|uniref:Uncharacterized protein n=1 Tax=Aspergillus glaucus CBS 516.65 TaxID=1160497 RepID=A0A1L9VJG2_ASPGL|nr:hypothetical protein ASPGLDRAFT_374544 [Aspergillus glaucus CBS 516.65]OJJ84020.1 hypothetical protein ASPGLDRAFT_374544 [Aspergillus glaucus CBS 516.65]
MKIIGDMPMIASLYVPEMLLACLLLATSLLIIALVVPGFLGRFLTVNNCRTTVRKYPHNGPVTYGGCLAHDISSAGDWTTWKSLKSIVHTKHKKIFFFCFDNIFFFYHFFLFFLGGGLDFVLSIVYHSPSLHLARTILLLDI